jgi:hypothetical protein
VFCHRTPAKLLANLESRSIAGLGFIDVGPSQRNLFRSRLALRDECAIRSPGLCVVQLKEPMDYHGADDRYQQYQQTLDEFLPSCVKVSLDNERTDVAGVADQQSGYDEHCGQFDASHACCSMKPNVVLCGEPT